MNGFSPNLMCALVLWRSGFGLLMGKFRQFMTKLSARDTSVFSFLDDNFGKYQWIFTKLGMSINIMEILFGIANRQILSIFDRVICPWFVGILFTDDNFSKYQWIYTKLGMCIDFVEIWFGIANEQILSIFGWVICPLHIFIFVLGP